MARAFVPKTVARAAGGRPPPHRPWPALELAPAATDIEALSQYLRLTGQRCDGTLPLMWPQVWGFRLQMALLTEPRFPLPIWSALQVRNDLTRLAAMPPGAAYGVSVGIERWRALDKGVEADLGCEWRDATGVLVWRSTTTYLWRGRRQGRPGPPAPQASSPPLQDAAPVDVWDSDRGGGWGFGVLTGDFNGLHWSDLYARAFGFARAFHHPSRVAESCLARLAIEHASAPQRLKLWFKGPVYGGSRLALRAVRPGADTCLFALHVDCDERPALVGRWRAAGGP